MKLGRVFMTIGSAAVLMTALAGCEVQAAEVTEEPKTPVEVMAVKSEQRPAVLTYMGTAVPEDQIDYSFKSSGRLGELLVSPGEHVEKGTVLAKLDTSDMVLQLDAIRAQMTAASQDITKAESAYAYNKDMLEKMNKLYESGGVSKDTLEQVELNYTTVSSSLSQARESYRAAKANYDLSAALLDDAVIVASSEGTVMAVPFEEGELVSAGYPVVVMRSETKVVQVGISQDDIDVVDMDTRVYLQIDGEEISGEISEINDMPDQYTRTFLVKVRTDNEKIRLGKIVDVKFEAENQQGIWVPLESIMSDGEQFVYVIQNGRAFKKTLTIDDVTGFEAEVSGLADGDQIVVAGIKKLTDGTAVEIVTEQ